MRRNLLLHTLPLGVSVAIHALLIVAAAGIVWRVAHQPAPIRETVVSFDDPAPARATEPVSEPAPIPGRPEGTQRPAAAPTRSPITIATPQPSGPNPEGVAQQISPGQGEPGTLDISGRAAARPAGGGVSFAGLGTSNARHIVYVVDASGPMVTTLPRVLEEVQRSVGRLSASQRFNVVLFRRIEGGGGTQVERFQPRSVRALPEARRRLAAWLPNVRPMGRSAPLAGLEDAIALEPDAIFLLSRSIERSGGGVWEFGLGETLRRLDVANPRDPASGRRPIVIQTIQFLQEDPTGILPAIGREHGSASGSDNTGYRVVRSSADLAAPEIPITRDTTPQPMDIPANPDGAALRLDASVERVVSDIFEIEQQLDTLHADGADTSVLYGIATPDQRQRVERAARSALTALDAAETRLHNEVGRLEQAALNGAADEVLARTDAGLTRLLDVESRVRIPLLRARAAQLRLAAPRTEQIRLEMITLAIASLRSVTTQDPLVEAWRLTMLAGILHATDDDRALEHADRAVEILAQRPTRVPSRAALEALLVAHAAAPDTRRVDELLAGRVGDANLVDPVTDRLARMLIAERSIRASIGPDGIRDRTSLARSINALVSLWEPDPDNELSASPLGRLIESKLATLDASMLPLSDLAPIVTIAIASRPDRGGSDRAIVMLDQLLDRPDAIALRTRTAWLLAARLVDSAIPADQLRAATLLTDISESHNGTDLGNEARTNALALCDQLPAAEIDELERQLLSRLPIHPAPPNLSPRQTLRLAHIEIARHDPHTMTQATLDRIIPLLSEATRDPALLESADATARTLFDTLLEEPDGKRITVARRAVDWTTQHSPEHRVAYTLILGSLLINEDPSDAIALLQSVTDDPLATQTQRLHARLDIARALRADANDADAFSTLRTLSTDLVALNGSDTEAAAREPILYWSVWAEMLEILVRQDPSTEQVDSIMRHLRRLELIDPEFGGTETGGRIEAVRRRLSDTAQPDAGAGS